MTSHSEAFRKHVCDHDQNVGFTLKHSFSAATIGDAMKNDSCPSAQQLNGFARGVLPHVEADQLVSHLDACPSCEETMHGLDAATDPFLSALRKPIADAELNYLKEDEYREAIATVSGLSSATRPSKNDSSVELDPALNDAVHVGDLIRDYELLDILGRGGMGVVYRARHVKLDRIVAVKVLSKKALHDDSMVERFEREMQAVGKLDHANIVRAHDAGEFDGLHYLVMEYVDGANLSALVKTCGPLSVADACELVRQAAFGLEDVHTHGLVHRDLKPANLMLTAAGVVKILDLGLARLHENNRTPSELTSTGQVMGTIDYMSPEQAENTHDVDIRADIYSLGATLHALLIGRAPFAGEQYGSAMKKLVALSTESPTRIDNVRSEVSVELADLVQKMLAKHSHDRPQTPREIVAALVPFAVGHNVTELIEKFHSTRESDDGVAQSTQSSLAMSSAFAETAIGDPSMAGRPTPASHLVTADKTASAKSPESHDVRKAERVRTPFRWQRAAVITAVAVLLFLYSGQMIRIVTGSGLLIIEANSESIEVTVLKGDTNNAAAIVDHATGRKYTLDISDDYRVVVTEAETGIELCSKRVTITRGGTSVLEVTAKSLAVSESASQKVPGPAVSDRKMGLFADAAAVARDRENAEWAFEIGADKVWIQFDDKSAPIEMQSASEFPAERFRLQGIALTLQHELTLATISRLATCEFLTTVSLDAPEIRFSDASVRALAQLPRLEVFSLARSLVRPSQIRIIGEHATTLKSLALTSCRNIDAAALTAVATSTDLEELDLSAVALNDVDVHSIYSMTSLRKLNLVQTSLDLTTVENVADALPECTIKSDFGRFVPLSVSGALAADKTPHTERENVEWAFKHGANIVGVVAVATGIQQQIHSVQEIPDEPFMMMGGIWDFKEALPAGELPRLAGLTHMNGSYFNVHGFNVGDDFISALLSWRQMEQLGLHMGDVTHEQVARVLRHFPDLVALSLAHSTGVDDKMLSILASHDKLATLSLQETAVTDAGLRSLQDLKSLTSIQVKGTQVTQNGIDELSRALPKCRIESDHGFVEPSND